MLTRSEIFNLINKKIRNAKAKIGGDDELQNICNEGIRKIQTLCSFPSTKRKSTPFMVYSDVFEYALPIDCAYDKISRFIVEKEEYSLYKSDFEKAPKKYLFSSRNPYKSSIYNDRNSTIYDDNVLMNCDISTIAIDFIDGKPILNVKYVSQTNTAALNTMESLTENGTWSVSGDGANLRADNVRYKEGSASLAFDSSGATTTISLANSTMTAVDLSSYEAKSSVLCWVYLPSTVPSSITMKWGSSAGNYLSKTITTQQNGLAFKNGWNLLSFDWESATETGTVDCTAVNYLDLTLTNASATAQTGYKVDYIFCAQGVECAIDYYSKYFVLSNAGVRKEYFTAGDDQIILNEEEVDIYIDQCVQIALENMREFNDAKDRERMKKENIDAFLARFPEDEELTSITYYNM